MTVTDTAVSVYLNGLMEDTGELAAPLTNIILGDAAIGGWNRDGTDVQREMTGSVDDVRIYNRGLSPAEIAYLAIH
jgi:hypothetical protein